MNIHTTSMVRNRRNIGARKNSGSRVLDSRLCVDEHAHTSCRRRIQGWPPGRQEPGVSVPIYVGMSRQDFCPMGKPQEYTPNLRMVPRTDDEEDTGACLYTVLDEYEHRPCRADGTSV